MAKQIDKLLDELTKGEVQELIDACLNFKPEILGPGNETSGSALFRSSKYGWYWPKEKDFEIEVGALTNTTNIVAAEKILEKQLTKAPQQPAANRPGKEELETLEGKAEARIKAKAAAREEGTRQTQEFIESQLRRVKNIKVEPKEEVPTITLSQGDKEKLHDMGVAANTDPGTTQKIIENKIQESLSKSSQEVKDAVPDEIVSKAAVDLVDKVKPYGGYASAEEIPTKIQVVNPASPIAAIAILNDAKLKGLITDEEMRKILVENAQSLALALENERGVNSSLTNSILYKYPNISSVLYGPEQITQFQIAEDQSEQNGEGVDLDVREVVDRGSDIRDFWQKISSGKITTAEATEATTTFVSSYAPSVNISLSSQATSLLGKALPTTGAIAGFKTGALAQQWLVQGAPRLMTPQIAGWLTSGGSQQIVASSAFSSKFALQTMSGKYGLAIATGKNVYGANVLMAGIKAGGSKLAIVSSATGTKIAASGIFARIGAFLGSAGPVVGTAIGAAIGWLVGKIAEKIPWHKVKKVIPFIAGLILLPFFGPVVGIAGGLGTHALMGGFSGGAIGGGILRFFWILGRNFGIAIGTPILVAILVFPVIVALILFIINSGAYIVPPSPLTLARVGQVVSPYIDVKKTANPAGPFTNTDLDITIEYTVEISAKKSPLTNIQINDNCTVRKTSGTSSCPNPEPSLPDLSGISISPGSPYSFTFSMLFTSPGFEDSRISNSITVTADTPEQSGTKAAGSASIKIGNPPEDCPHDWPVYPEGEPYLVVLQGPHTRGGTHDVIEAIDIFSPDEPNNTAILGNQVKATHQGSVVVGSGGNYGRFVDITSSCAKPDGTEVEVTSRYAHLSAVSVTTGQTAGKDQVIGLAGSSGTPWPHLHYEFRPAPGPIKMVYDYIPITVPAGCFDGGGRPCNVRY